MLLWYNELLINISSETAYAYEIEEKYVVYTHNILKNVNIEMILQLIEADIFYLILGRGSD